MSEKPTREMIMNEPEGRQMDAWVELFVMSGELKTMWNIMTADGTGIYDGPFERESIAIDNLKKETWLHDTGAKVGNFQAALNTYSTDIAAAWQVMEKFQSFELQMDTPVSWFAMAHLAGWGWGQNAWANTAPLAICRAALAVVLEATLLPHPDGASA